MGISVTVDRGTEQVESVPEKIIEPSELGAEENVEDIEPVTSSNRSDIVLKAMGVLDEASSLSEEDSSNLDEVTRYLTDLVSKKGLQTTKGVYERTLKDVMAEMDIDPDTEPSRVLSKIGNVVRAWRDLSFIRSPDDRRRMFMKLARMDNAKDMDALVIKAMEENEVFM
jgi:hypothetical protein